MPNIPWAVIISLLVLAGAYLIKHVISHIVEEEHVFLRVIAVFLVMYVGAAVAVTWLNPHISATQEYPAENG